MENLARNYCLICCIKLISFCLMVIDLEPKSDLIDINIVIW